MESVKDGKSEKDGGHGPYNFRPRGGGKSPRYENPPAFNDPTADNEDKLLDSDYEDSQQVISKKTKRKREPIPVVEKNEQLLSGNSDTVLENLLCKAVRGLGIDEGPIKQLAPKLNKMQSVYMTAASKFVNAITSADTKWKESVELFWKSTVESICNNTALNSQLKSIVVIKFTSYAMLCLQDKCK